MVYKNLGKAPFWVMEALRIHPGTKQSCSKSWLPLHRRPQVDTKMYRGSTRGFGRVGNIRTRGTGTFLNPRTYNAQL